MARLGWVGVCVLWFVWLMLTFRSHVRYLNLCARVLVDLNEMCFFGNMGQRCCLNSSLLNERKTGVCKANVFWFSNGFPQFFTQAPCFGSMWWHRDREFGVSSDSGFQQHWQVCKLYQDQWQPYLPCHWDSWVSDKMLRCYVMVPAETNCIHLLMMAAGFFYAMADPG